MNIFQRVVEKMGWMKSTPHPTTTANAVESAENPKLRSVQPSKELLLQVRLAFLANGSSLHCWCQQNKVDRSYAAKCISGVYVYPSAVNLKARILQAVDLPSIDCKVAA